LRKQDGFSAGLFDDRGKPGNDFKRFFRLDEGYSIFDGMKVNVLIEKDGNENPYRLMQIHSELPLYVRNP
jgi:hypothetical protein